ncbi:MAG: TonB-dependent receptor [Woeseiaceae bacterium]|nr:TonB-dependent receptor [Woeseiaceae bacterium]
MSKLSKINGLRHALALGASMVAAIVVFMQPNHALAQEGSAGALLEEIVTVARKKSDAEAVQDVPLAVTAFGAEQLDALFVKKIEDLSYIMPNVQLESVGTFPGVQNFSIRGQGINSSIPSVDPTVGVFVDGIFMGTTYGVVIDTFDLEAVEVLRGPQGLLFGRNVTGGAVVLRNARPTGEFGARVRVGGTDEEQFNIAAAIEGALIEDKLAAKMVVLYDDDPGYFQNTNSQAAANPVHPLTPLIAPAPHFLQPFYANAADNSTVGALETKLLRPTLVWTPTDTSEIALIVEHGETEGDGAAWTSVTAQRAGTIPDFTTYSDEDGFTNIEWTQWVLETNIGEVGNGTLTNIAGYRRVEADSAADIDGTDLPIFSAPGFTDQKQFSNEFRWSGNFGERWEATLGLYYFNQDITYREGRYIWLPPGIGPAPLGINLTRALGGDMDSRNFGAFWNNDFHLSDALTITVGVRYTDESKSASIIDSTPVSENGPGPCPDVTSFVCPTIDLSGDWDNVTPKLGFQFQLNDSAHIYGFWSKGFRSGGFNFRNAKPTVIPPGPTSEEENNTIEVGLKSDLLDGRMRVNLAVFHNDIQDMQRELNIPDNEVIVLQGTINAGDVTIQGVELDFVALVTDSFSVNASYGWQDGEYDSVNPAFASFLGPELPRLAPTNYSVGVSWDIPLANGLVNLAANHSFRERHPYDDANLQFFDDQRRTNASINWLSGDDTWSVSLYGKNLEDEANWGNLTSIAGLWTAGPMKKGRVMGLEVNYRIQ